MKYRPPLTITDEDIINKAERDLKQIGTFKYIERTGCNGQTYIEFDEYEYYQYLLAEKIRVARIGDKI